MMFEQNRPTVLRRMMAPSVGLPPFRSVTTAPTAILPQVACFDEASMTTE